MARKSHFRKLWVKFFFPKAVQELLYQQAKWVWRWLVWVLRNSWSKKCKKMTILRGDDIKWRIRAISGSCGLKIFPSQVGSRVTLPVREVGLALAILSSEKLSVKERPENGVFGTFRCRQIGRRGLNRKTVMIDRFHVSNYPPVQIFSEKYDKMS